MKNWEKRAIFWLLTIGALALSQWSLGREVNHLRERIETLEKGQYGNVLP